MLFASMGAGGPHPRSPGTALHCLFHVTDVCLLFAAGSPPEDVKELREQLKSLNTQLTGLHHDLRRDTDTGETSLRTHRPNDSQRKETTRSSPRRVDSLPLAGEL